jgi:putative transposase
VNRSKFAKEEAFMNDCRSLSLTKWDCRFHVVWIPKYRKKTLYGEIRRQLGPVFRELANQKESHVVEGKLLKDHVHMLIAIPPKYAVAQAIGYFVSTAGMDEETVREYIKKQEDEDKKLDQLKMFDEERYPWLAQVFNRFERFTLSIPRLWRGISGLD